MTATQKRTPPATRPMRRLEWEKKIRRAKFGMGSTAGVAFAMGTYSDSNGSSVFPGDKRVAEGLGLSLRTVGRAVKQLETCGWITRPPGAVGSPNNPVRWQLSIALTGAEAETATHDMGDLQPDHLSHYLLSPKDLVEVEATSHPMTTRESQPHDSRRQRPGDYVEYDEGGNPLRHRRRHQTGGDSSAYGSRD